MIEADFNGTLYNNREELCKAYGITCILLSWRLNNGYTYKEALLMPVSIGKVKIRLDLLLKKIQDHWGNMYDTYEDLAAAYKLDTRTFRARMKRYNNDIEMALTCPLRHGHIKVKDFVGNCFYSVKHMCTYYKTTEEMFNWRLENGYSFREALTTPHYVGKIKKETQNIKQTQIINTGLQENGLIIPPVYDKTNECQQTSTYLIEPIKPKSSINTSLTASAAIKPPCVNISDYEQIRKEKLKHRKIIREQNKDVVKLHIEPIDHLGNKYKSVAEMACIYDITAMALRYRLSMGWTLKQALTTPIKHK